MLTAIAFYVFAAILLIAAFLVISARNPVHAVLALILAFFNGAALFVLLGAEFLAMILLMVYVGAVAVLFLFVVMMLDVKFPKVRTLVQQYAAFGASVGGVLALELVAIVALRWGAPVAAAAVPIPDGISNTEALGRLLYTDYMIDFQAAGLVLLVAMIGAIVLTLRKREGVRRQSVWRQVARDPAETVTLIDIEPGKGA